MGPTVSARPALDSIAATQVLAAIPPPSPRAVRILATHYLPAWPDVVGPAWTRVLLE